MSAFSPVLIKSRYTINIHVDADCILVLPLIWIWHSCVDEDLMTAD